MSSQRAMRKILSLILVLSVGWWAESGWAMLSVAGNPLACPAAMSHANHLAAAIPCCPSHAASLLTHFVDPPPCCDLRSQQARPLALVVISGKFCSGPLSVNGTVGMTFVPPPRKSAISLPFVKPDLVKKTDLRI